MNNSEHGRLWRAIRETLEGSVDETAEKREALVPACAFLPRGRRNPAAGNLSFQETRLKTVRTLITPSRRHRTLDGLALTRARERVGLTQELLAARCGWSRTQQVRLERPGRHEVRVEVAEALTLALAMGKGDDNTAPGET